MEDDRFLEMALVGRPWGREGAVTVILSTDRPEDRFASGVELEGRLGASSRPLTVAWWRPRRQGAVIKFEEIDGIDGAESIRGMRVGLPRGVAETRFGPRLLLDDLRGLEVVSPEGRILGRVRDVDDAGPQTLLVVDTGRGEVLVPFHDDLCSDIDPAAGRLVVNAPDGLFPAASPES